MFYRIGAHLSLSALGFCKPRIRIWMSPVIVCRLIAFRRMFGCTRGLSMLMRF